jgi:hypothetical protein
LVPHGLLSSFGSSGNRVTQIVHAFLNVLRTLISFLAKRSNGLATGLRCQQERSYHSRGTPNAKQQKSSIIVHWFFLPDDAFVNNG